MKRTVLICLTSLLVLAACERYPGQQVDATREQPGASVAEYQESTADDQLLDNPIPGTDTTLQEGEAATGPNAAGAADPVDPGVDAETQTAVPDATNAQADDAEVADAEVTDTAVTDTAVTDTEVAEAAETPLPDVQNVSPDPVGAGPVETTPIDVSAVATGSLETGGAETGGVAAGNSETVAVAESAESGGAAETASVEGDAEVATDETGDLERIGETSTVLADADAARAVATIEAWQARLDGSDDPDLATVSEDLATLKTELQADSPDEATVKTLLYKLGQETSRLALVAPQNVGDALNALGTSLSEAGEESALADAPVDIGGAMPGVAQSATPDEDATNEVATVVPNVSPPATPGALDMNLQTGTVERDDLGVLDASLALSAETGGAVRQTSQPAETGGAETGGTLLVGETGGAETGGAETGGAESEISEAETQENVTSSQAPEVTEGELLASARLKDVAGTDVGVVNVVSSDAGLTFEFGLQEGATLQTGEHGFHVHETGSCTPDFEAAGAHLNPDGSSHGLLSADGPHAGDLPNLNIPESGTPTYVVTTTRLSEADLFDADGSAMIVHADPDDYVTDPGGNSGDRVACGVLERVPAN